MTSFHIHKGHLWTDIDWNKFIFTYLNKISLFSVFLKSLTTFFHPSQPYNQFFSFFPSNVPVSILKAIWLFFPLVFHFSPFHQIDLCFLWTLYTNILYFILLEELIFSPFSWYIHSNSPNHAVFLLNQPPIQYCQQIVHCWFSN